jgi:hypothetical protein
VSGGSKVCALTVLTHVGERYGEGRGEGGGGGKRQDGRSTHSSNVRRGMLRRASPIAMAPNFKMSLSQNLERWDKCTTTDTHQQQSHMASAAYKKGRESRTIPESEVVVGMWG